MSDSTSTLLITCPDRPGIVAAVSSFLLAEGANIVHADQHVDRETGLFLQRIEFAVEERDTSDLRDGLSRLAADYQMTWSLRPPHPARRVAILTSRESHCLADLLSRWDIGELQPARLAFVASNHPDHRDLVEHKGIPFHHIPVETNDPEGHHRRVRELIEGHGVDLLILARYMRVLPPATIEPMANRIINIHHSFLPAFAGARPYHQAHARGVKLIGATAHYVTSALDDGPIIAQDVLPVSHRDGVDELRQKGRDLEKIVLARAVRLHLADRVLPYGNRTAVFD